MPKSRLSLAMTVGGARKLLMLSWFGCFLGALAIVIYLYVDDWMEKDNFKLAISGLNTLYSPYVGAITLWYWGSKKTDASKGAIRVGGTFLLALGGTVVWNAIILIFLLPVAFHAGTIEDALDNVAYVAGVLSWLVAGAIGYYFSNPSQKTAATE